MTEVVDFWFRLGVDGLRLDAVPYLYEREGTSCENLPETHAFLKQLDGTSTERFPNRMLLAEANQWPEEAAAYFGDGDECHMAFHFPLMPRLFMAIRTGDRFADLRHSGPDPADSRDLPVGTTSWRSFVATGTSGSSWWRISRATHRWLTWISRSFAGWLRSSCSVTHPSRQSASSHTR